MFVRNDKAQPQGNKIDYRPYMAQEVYKFALLGFTIKDLAMWYGISERTFVQWLDQYEELREAYHRGGEYADACVAVSTYKAANGYSHPETKYFQYEGQVVKVETIKHYPPDIKAAKFWLLNRQRKSGRWVGETKLELSGPNGGPIELTPKPKSIDLSDIGDEQLFEMLKIGDQFQIGMDNRVETDKE